MTLNLAFLLIGAALLAGAGVSYRSGGTTRVRSLSAAGLAVGAIMFLIGLVNALSGTM